MIDDLAPLIGRRFSFGVVPNWHAAWPLAGHRDYCWLVSDSSEELLLHGFFHQRLRGSGPTTWLTDGSDEMNGLTPEETARTIARGQRVFTEVFGEPARGFVAPAWQQGHIGNLDLGTVGLQHVLGYFALESAVGNVPLATWSWHCGRWGWLGHVGHEIGQLLHAVNRGVPTLAIHPEDLANGFWPKILRLIEQLLDQGYEPSTCARLLNASDVEVTL
jgi:hypothetical protein